MRKAEFHIRSNQKPEGSKSVPADFPTRESPLAAVRAIGEGISSIHEVDELIKLVVRSLTEKLGYQRTLIIAKDEKNGFLVQQEAGFSSCDIGRIEQEGKSFLKKLAGQTQVIFIPPESPQRKEIESLFSCTSIIAGAMGRKWLLVTGKTLPNDPLAEEDVEIVRTLISQASTALSSIELFKTLRRDRDQLKQAKASVEEHAKMTIRANLELTQKEERLSRKINGFSVLYDIGQLIGGTHQLRELLDLVTESLVMRLEYDRSLIARIQPEGVATAAQIGFSLDEIERIEVGSLPFLSRTMKEGKGVLLKSEPKDKNIEELFGCTSLIIVPLREKEFLIAGKRIIYDAMTPDDLETLSILAGQVKIAIENVELYQQLLQERDQLQKAKQDLEEWSMVLEQRVRERTRKLEEAQQQLIQASKLVAIGELGAGVAHELNNPLGGVLGYAQLAMEKIEQIRDSSLKEQIDRYLKIIEEETQRCKQIIGGLLRFSRSGIQEKPVHQSTSIEEIMENTLKLIRYQLEMHQIALTVEVEPGLPKVSGNGSQLQQVFTNIILNADQAMPKGGRLRITASKDSGKPGMISIRFQDTGRGIAPEHLSRVFDPFFTTKATGEGTGLGLSISYGIIQDHRGQITVESELKKGTLFTVFLPEEAGD